MKTIDFYGKRKVYFTISLSLLVIGIVFSFLFGINLDIQFKGGSIITYSYQGDMDKNKFEETVQSIVGSDVTVQGSEDVSSGTKYVKISLAEAKGIESNIQAEVSNKLHELFPNNNVQIASVNSVDPTIGKEFFAKSLIAVLFASVLMIVYVGFRFKTIGGWSAGVMAVIALFHDVIVAFVTFIVFRYPLNDNFIAVVLTILGFSLNDTIVIYDRIRENKRLYGSKLGFAELVNKSITQSLSRSIVTSLAALLAMLVVAIVAVVYNVSSIVTFAIPMFVGLVSGVYSTVCIAGPLYVMWHEHKMKKKAA